MKHQFRTDFEKAVKKVANQKAWTGFNDKRKTFRRVKLTGVKLTEKQQKKVQKKLQKKYPDNVVEVGQSVEYPWGRSYSGATAKLHFTINII